MYIIDYKRSPIGKFLGALAHYTAPQLTLPLFHYFLDRYPFLKTRCDEVIMGNVIAAGIGQNPARIAAYHGGIGDAVPAYTINQVCASGMNALVQGYRSIKLGESQLVLAGGMESMSQAPYLVQGARTGLTYGTTQLLDAVQQDGLYCSLAQVSMGETVEIIAKKYHILREAQDQYALQSHRRAVSAEANHVFAQEIVPFPELQKDEGPRPDTSLDKLEHLKAIFKPKGSVTAGNASSINDGAALTLLASPAALKKYHLKPKAMIIDTVLVGLKPILMGMGPKVAIDKLLRRNRLKMEQIDLLEINEAFAVQVLAVIQSLHLDPKKINIYGGAIAMGHPLGMSGARIVGNLINGLQRTGGSMGIASLCAGGGQGAAILVKTI